MTNSSDLRNSGILQGDHSEQLACQQATGSCHCDGVHILHEIGVASLSCTASISNGFGHSDLVHQQNWDGALVATVFTTENLLIDVVVVVLIEHGPRPLVFSIWLRVINPLSDGSNVVYLVPQKGRMAIIPG